VCFVHITISYSHARGFSKRYVFRWKCFQIFWIGIPQSWHISPHSEQDLIYSDVEFLMSILIQVHVDAREVQPSLIPLLQLHPHADHHALRRAGSLT